MPEANFDQMVGRVAGAIYSDISREFPQPPLVLVPTLTFKVRKILEQVTDLRLFSQSQIEELATEIEISIIPMLFSFEIDPVVIEKLAPVIKSAAAKALGEI